MTENTSTSNVSTDVKLRWKRVQHFGRYLFLSIGSATFANVKAMSSAKNFIMTTDMSIYSYIARAGGTRGRPSRGLLGTGDNSAQYINFGIRWR
jgi:hypothetical protein